MRFGSLRPRAKTCRLGLSHAASNVATLLRVWLLLVIGNRHGFVRPALCSYEEARSKCNDHQQYRIHCNSRIKCAKSYYIPNSSPGLFKSAQLQGIKQNERSSSSRSACVREISVAIGRPNAVILETMLRTNWGSACRNLCTGRKHDLLKEGRKGRPGEAA
jgi:hypothetical protein